MSGRLWSGESASVPSRVHVLPRIDDGVVYDGGGSFLKLLIASISTSKPLLHHAHCLMSL